MDSLLSVDPRAIPAEGRKLAGALPAAMLELSADSGIHPTGPIEFQLKVFRDDDDLLLTGRLTAPFQLDCVRCLQPIEFIVDLDDYESAIPIENDQIIDLTNGIREDILLTLPSYPRCEDGNVSPHDCSAEGRFDPGSEDEQDSPAEDSNSGTWDALDQLKS
jgi:uncharacterized protein